MERSRYERQFVLFDRARNLAGNERARFLERACSGDEALRREIEELLAQHAKASHPLGGGGIAADPEALGEFFGASRRAPSVGADQESSLFPEGLTDLGTVPERARSRSDVGASTGLAPGTVVGPFVLGEELGRGGMGVVHRATQQRPQREVALKFLPPDAVLTGQAARFEREIEALGRLQHANIATIHAAGTVDLGFGAPTPYLAMELVEGETIRDHVRQSDLNARACCELIVQVCQAVQHAHERGVVHRDLKPGNVLVTAGPQGSHGVVKVLDFGIARLVDRAGDAFETRTGSVLGTPQYMSPEQIAGRTEDVDRRTDVYALGVLLYELTARRFPLDLAGRSLAEAVRIVEQEPPQRLGTVDARLRGDLETIVHKALAKIPADRYDSVGELGQDLQRFLRGEPVLARPPSFFYQARRYAKRNRVLVGGISATFVTLAVGLAVALVLLGRNRDLAIEERDARLDAEHNASELRRELYAAEMRLAGDAMQLAGGVGRMRDLIEKWEPQPDVVDPPPDLRGFEWYLLWAAGHQETRVHAHGGRVGDVRFAKDGSSLFSRGDRITLESGKVEPVLPGFDVWSVSANGRVALCRSGRELSVHEVPGAAERLRVELPENRLIRYDLSPDGSLFAVIWGSPHRVWVFDTETGERLTELYTRGSGYYEQAFSSDGTLFAVTKPDGRCEVGVYTSDDWSEPRYELHGGKGHASRLRFSHDGRFVGRCTRQGELIVWDVHSGEVVLHDERAEGLRDVVFSPDGSQVAAACTDFTVHVHDLETGSFRQLQGHRDAVRSVDWSVAGGLVSNGEDGVLRAWDLERIVVRELPLAAGRKSRLTRFHWRADGRELSVRWDGGLATWNLDTGVRRDYERLLPDDRRFVVRDIGGGISVFDAAAFERHEGPGDPEPLLEYPLGPAACREWHPTRPLVATGGKGGTWIFDYLKAEFVTEAPSPEAAIDLRWSRDGEELLRLDREGRIVWHDLEGLPARTLELDDGARIQAFGQTETDEALLLACDDQSIRTWTRTEGVVNVLRGHGGHVHTVDLSPCGRRIASGGFDGTVRIWDVETDRELLSLRANAGVVGVAWSPDGRQLAVADETGRTVVWDATDGYRAGP